MNTPLLFIHGGGDDGYRSDKLMAQALQKHLGDGVRLLNPKMPADESKPDFGWIDAIKKHLEEAGNNVLLVGHSLGASMILRFLSERKSSVTIRAAFLLAAPFWGSDEDWQAELGLAFDFAQKLPKDLPLYFYQCKDDDVVPFKHLSVYKKELGDAQFTEFRDGGHALNGHLKTVAADIHQRLTSKE